MKTKNDIKKILIKIIIINLTLGFLLFMAFERYKEISISKKNYEVEKIDVEKSDTKTEPLDNHTEIKQYPKENVIKTYKGYDVCAKLEIPSISLETNILSNYSIKALNVSVTKFWGAQPNQIGNFCVAGHNFVNKNMFKDLKKLKVGDRLFVTDNKIGKVEYEIFAINTVLPNDTSCLDSSFNNEREITLITCTIDSKYRIIVKAKEIL